MNTIDEIISDIMLVLSEDDLTEIRGVPNPVALHHGLGTWIRNTYSLWYTSELTRNWHENESARNIIDGIDYSDDHPDAVSGKIINELVKRLNSVVE